MIDFPIQESPTFVQCLFVILLYFVVIKFNYDSNIKNFGAVSISASQTRHLFELFLIVVVCYFLAGDFWNYQLLVTWKHYLDAPQWNHMEETYTPIIAFIDRNYLLFRLIVWGGASVLTYICLKFVCKIPHHALFILFTCNVGSFARGRVTLALAIYFLGIAILLSDYIRVKILKYAIGIVLIGSSYFFHHSVLMLIAITPIIFFPINKFTVAVTVFAIPVLIFMLQFVLGEMAASEVLEEEGIAERLSDFNTNKGYTSFKLIQRYYSYSTVIVSAFLFVKLYLANNRRSFTRAYQGFLGIMCGTIIIAFCTIAVVPTDVFFYRFFAMTFIPFSVLMCYLHENGIMSNKTFYRLWLFNVGSPVIGMLYKIYASLVGGQM